MIQKLSEKIKDEMKEEFKTVEFMSATSDIWQRSNRSFIAVTVHYFDEDLNLKSKFIACERFMGSHTNRNVAEKLNSIFGRFGILEKVFFITTDGAGEYTAAIKYHGDNNRLNKALNTDVDFEWLSMGTDPYFDAANPNQNKDAIVSTETEFDSDSDVDNYDSTVVCNANELLTMPCNVVLSPLAINENVNENEESFIIRELFVCDDDTDISDLLPNLNRIGCSAHLLDKLGKKDALNARFDQDYAAMYDLVFGKLHTIWDIKESRLFAEIFTRITKRKIVGPHRIRWSQTFNAVSTKCLLI